MIKSNTWSRLLHPFFKAEANRDGFSPSFGTDGRYFLPLKGYEAPTWNLGVDDGRIGQPKHTELTKYVEAAAREEIERRRNELQNKAAALEKKIIGAEDLKTKLALDYERVKAKWQEIWETRHEQYHDFFWPSGLIYLAVALVLILADIPLSLKLVADGFDWRTEIDGITFDLLFTRPVEVMQKLWEPALLAIGIALTAIFFKYYYEEFIVHRFRKQFGSNKFIIIMSAVLVLSLCTIFVLGMFRSEVQNRLLQLQMGTSNVAAELFWSKPTFILLTLLFPLVGAICFGYGFTILQNASQYYGLQFSQWRHRKRLNTISKRLQHSQAEKSTTEQDLNKYSDSKYIEPMMASLKDLYLHGYNRGYYFPETVDPETELYKKCEKIIDKMLSARVRNQMWQQKSNGNGHSHTVPTSTTVQ